MIVGGRDVSSMRIASGAVRREPIARERRRYDAEIDNDAINRCRPRRCGQARRNADQGDAYNRCAEYGAGEEGATHDKPLCFYEAGKSGGVL